MAFKYIIRKLTYIKLKLILYYLMNQGIDLLPVINKVLKGALSKFNF